MNIQILWDDQADAPAITPAKAAANAAMLKDALKAKNPLLELSILEGKVSRRPMRKAKLGKKLMPEQVIARERAILSFIADKPHSKIYEIALGLDIATTTASDVTLGLRDRGLTELQKIGTARPTNVITPKGRAYLAEQEGAA